MKSVRYFIVGLLVLEALSVSLAVESGMFRLLSISESEKLVLVSSIPDKSKYLLDVASAKITVDGKPAEIEELKAFTVIQVQWNQSNEKRNGIRIDGMAVEIEVETPESTSD